DRAAAPGRAVAGAVRPGVLPGAGRGGRAGAAALVPGAAQPDAAGTVQPQPALRPSAGGTPGAPARTRTAGRGGALHAPGDAGLGAVLLRQQPGADGPGAVGALVLVDALHRVDLIRPDRPVVRWRMAGTSASKETRMTWLPLTDLLLQPHAGRQVALAPALDHAELQQR